MSTKMHLQTLCGHIKETDERDKTAPGKLSMCY